MTNAIILALEKLKNPEKAVLFLRYFKTGKGDYGEGDIFWGLTVPQTRSVAKKFKSAPIADVIPLLHHEVHEVRLCGLEILCMQFKDSPKEVYEAYINNLEKVNNWDLVDLSAPKIAGAYLFDKKRRPLYDFAKSDNLWKKRIAIISTAYFIKQGEYKDTFEIAKILLNDKHDLIHKAVGWMLREVGNYLGQDVEKKFLNKYISIMPATMLRYAIEKFPKDQRQKYLLLRKNS